MNMIYFIVKASTMYDLNQRAITELVYDVFFKVTYLETRDKACNLPLGHMFARTSVAVNCNS